MGRAYEVRKYSIQKTGAARGKIYTNFAKEIYLAAKKGIPNPDENVVLKRIIEKAKRQEVPNDIINRAIDKAKVNITAEGFVSMLSADEDGAKRLVEFFFCWKPFMTAIITMRFFNLLLCSNTIKKIVNWVYNTIVPIILTTIVVWIE